MLWDLKKKDDKGKPFRGHKAAIEDCDLAPGGQLIASVDAEGFLFITKVDGGEVTKLKGDDKMVSVIWKD